MLIDPILWFFHVSVLQKLQDFVEHHCAIFFPQFDCSGILISVPMFSHQRAETGEAEKVVEDGIGCFVENPRGSCSHQGFSCVERCLFFFFFAPGSSTSSNPSR